MILLEKVSKDYMLGDLKVTALKEISLTIAEGSFLVLSGPSGSGKSTLLNIIGLLDEPSSGRVEYEGTDVSKLSATGQAHFRRDHIGFIFQSYNLLPVLSAAENVAFTLALQGIGREERMERASEALRSVGLAGLEGRRPAQLSGGQQQRVAVARAIVHRPRVVLADEPTANLDSLSAHALIDVLIELNRSQGVTFVFSSHDDKVVAHAGRLVKMLDGGLSLA